MEKALMKADRKRNIKETGTETRAEKPIPYFDW